MSRVFTGSTSYLTGAAPLNSNVCTIVAWFMRAALATDYLVEIGVTGGGDYNALSVNGSGTVGAVSNATSATQAQSVTTSTDLTTWHLGVARFVSATSRFANQDNGAKGSQTLSRTPAAKTAFRIGASLIGNNNAFTGKIAHVAVYNNSLSDADVLALYTNLPTAVSPGTLVYYDSLNNNTSPEVSSVGALSMTVTNATYSTDMPPIGPPVISSIDVCRQGATMTITGTSFEPGATDATVNIGGIAQTPLTASNTVVTLTVDRGTLKYGPQVVQVTNSLGLSATFAVTLIPPTTFTYINLVDPLAIVGQRITSTLDVVAGDQIAYGAVVGGVLADGAVLPSGAFYWDEDVTDFDVEVNDGTGWGTTGTQTLDDPVAAPVLIGTIPTFIFAMGEGVQINLAQYATGWTSLALVTSRSPNVLPSGLTNTNGVITGAGVAASNTTITVNYTNGTGTTPSNSFHLIILAVLTVPDLTEFTQADAISALSVLGFLYSIATDNSELVPLGAVSLQSPVGGSQSVIGSTIALTISLGPVILPVQVPDITALSQASAETLLAAVNLLLRVISVPSAVNLSGIVIAQDPAPGTMVPLNSGVAAQIGTGVTRVRNMTTTARAPRDALRQLQRKA